MANRKSDVAWVLIPLMIFAGLGQTYAAGPELAWDDPLNDFDPFNRGGANNYDFDNPNYNVGDCDPIPDPPVDVDGDGDIPYSTARTTAWANLDKSCFELQDWDQDGICDHRVFEGSRSQSGIDFQPTVNRFEEILPGSGVYSAGVPNPNICQGWSPA